MIPFEKVLRKIESRSSIFTNYAIREDYLRSLYFYASLLPEDATVVEIGTLYGVSLVTMAAALKGNWSIIGIDPVLKGEFHYPDCHKKEGHAFTSSYGQVFKLAEDCGVNFNNSDKVKTGLITLYGLPSWEVLEIMSGTYDQNLDLVFIDGEHSTEAIRKDLEWGSLVKPGGYMVIDDWFFEISNETKAYVAREGNWTILHESTSTPEGDYIVTILQKESNKLVTQ